MRTRAFAPLASDEVLDLLRREIAAERQARESLAESVAALQRDLDRLRRPQLSWDDRRRLAALLPPLAGVVGDQDFAASDITESDAPALRVVVTGWSTKRIGRLLTRAATAGEPVVGLLVTIVEGTRATHLYRVEKVIA